MNKNETKDVLVYIETADGKPVKVSEEILSPARTIAAAKGAKVIAAVIGDNPADAADQIAHAGADEVLAVESPDFKDYNLDQYADVLAQIAEEIKPDTILFGATQDGKDLAPKVASALKTGCVTDAVNIAVADDGTITWTMPMYSGTVLDDVVIEEARPQIGSIRSGAFKKLDEAPEGTVTKKDVTVSDDAIKAEILESVKELAETVNLEEAEIIVSGGRGMGSVENFQQVKVLADLLGGVVGATRPAIEDGWIPRNHQVGQSGKIVSPKLYIACGISGATQHLSGITGSDYIVAINKDEDAPIFEVANVGIVGDVNKVLPVMIEEITKIKEQA
ncbi:MAG: electron transfer flavoprotein subunit alpha/FixB family protein [Eubacteriaceae bacterium]|jgi:electron transfer flavoprotein alpha subunit